MNILQIVCDGAPGGGTNHVLQLLNGLGGNFKCQLLTESDSYLSDMAGNQGIEVYGGNFFRSRVDRKAIARIQEVVESTKPDLIHCHGGRAAFFESFLPMKTPVVYTVHGIHYAQKRLSQRALGWLAELRTMRKMSHVIFVSEHDKNLAMRHKLLHHRQSCSVIHNGIAAPLSRARKKDMGIGFVGRFVHQKNPELFLDIVERMPDENFVMVGGGELESSIKTEIRRRNLGDRVTLLGRLDHKETIDVISNLRTLVMTPRWEGLPLLPLEAMLLKVPVVSTAVGGIPEVLKHGETGLLDAEGSGESLATHVQELQQNPSLRERIVDNAFKFARENFLEEQMLEKTRQVYFDQIAQTTTRFGQSKAQYFEEGFSRKENVAVLNGVEYQYFDIGF